LTGNPNLPNLLDLSAFGTAGASGLFVEVEADKDPSFVWEGSRGGSLELVKIEGDPSPVLSTRLRSSGRLLLLLLDSLFLDDL
jgi:hypothetical protein